MSSVSSPHPRPPPPHHPSQPASKRQRGPGGVPISLSTAPSKPAKPSKPNGPTFGFSPMGTPRRTLFRFGPEAAQGKNENARRDESTSTSTATTTTRATTGTTMKSSASTHLPPKLQMKGMQYQQQQQRPRFGREKSPNIGSSPSSHRGSSGGELSPPPYKPQVLDGQERRKRRRVGVYIDENEEGQEGGLGGIGKGKGKDGKAQREGEEEEEVYGDENIPQKESERRELIAALLAQEKALGVECEVLEERRNLLAEKRKREEEGEELLAVKRVKVDLGQDKGDLESLIASLLSTNETSILLHPPPTTAPTTATTTTSSTEPLPTSRPHAPPSSPSHPHYRLFTPFRPISVSTHLIPSPTPTPILKHTINLTSPPLHNLLNLSLTLFIDSNDHTLSRFPDHQTQLTISSWARRECGPFIQRYLPTHNPAHGGGVLDGDINVLMYGLGRYSSLSLHRARVFSELVHGEWSAYILGWATTPPTLLRRRKQQQTRRDLARFLGERSLRFKHATRAGAEVVLNWWIGFDEAGEAVSRVWVDVVMGLQDDEEREGSASGREAGEGWNWRELGVGNRVEGIFGRLVRERGVVNAVGAVCEGLFGGEGRGKEGGGKEGGRKGKKGKKI